MAAYDKDSKLWQCLIQQPPNDDANKSPGQRILDAMSSHGSKVAQVFQKYFCI